jgi:hypothetical protein
MHGEGIPRTVEVLALIALLTSFGLAALDNLVAVTVETKHRNTDILSSCGRRYEYGIRSDESSNLKHDRPPIMERDIARSPPDPGGAGAPL